MTRIKARTEDSPPYAATSDDDIIAKALAILESRLSRAKVSITSPDAAKDYWRVALAEKPKR